MSLTYAIPDLHGRLDLLERALARIDSHRRGRDCTIVTLGDYVDRGPQSGAVIDRLIIAQEQQPLVALKGNHELMMWEACSRLAEPSRWLRYGGSETLRSYGAAADEVDCVPTRHLDWIGMLPKLHVDRHRIYVHAAVDPTLPLHQQDEETLLWKRYRRDFDVGHGQRHVVHGHHATLEAPLALRRRTNLDGGAWQTGRLFVGVFEDCQAGGAVDYLEIVD